MGRAAAGGVRALALRAVLLSVCGMVSVSGVVSGCRLLPGDTPVGTLVASWSEADHAELADDVRVEPQVLDDGAERTALLEQLPRTGQDAALAAADLGQVALVVHGYHRCVQTVLWQDRSGDLRFAIPEDERDTLCAWAPYTVEVWQVRYAEVDSAPGELRLRG